MDVTAIRTLRDSLGLTQRQLAERIGVSINTIKAWEHGTRAPGQEATMRLAIMAQPGKVRAATLSQSLEASADLADANAQADIGSGDPESAETAQKLAGHLRRLAANHRLPVAPDPMQIDGLRTQ